MRRVLVTGAAGFIGYHTCERLLEKGLEVTGLDNMNDYYEVSLKEARLGRLLRKDGFSFHRLNLVDNSGMAEVFREGGFDTVIHLAAQAGVRHSLQNPQAYVDSNLTGFTNVLEGCRHNGIKHLVYASTSSVYGLRAKMPFSTHESVDHPTSFYAATKRANELMAHTYAHLFGLPCTGLRFFTVYGPWGRPDMALFLFTKAILKDRPIDVFNQGKMRRDFTFVDDVVEGVVRAARLPAAPNPSWNPSRPDPATSSAPYRLYNVGNNNPMELSHYIEEIEAALGKKALKNYLPMQPGDIPSTYADIDDLASDFSFRPSTSIKDGVSRFVRWYREYYGV